MHVCLMNPKREVRYPDPDSLFNFSKKRDARICDQLQKGDTVSGSVSLFNFRTKRDAFANKEESRAMKMQKRDARICDHLHMDGMGGTLAG